MSTSAHRRSAALAACIVVLALADSFDRIPLLALTLQSTCAIAFLALLFAWRPTTDALEESGHIAPAIPALLGAACALIGAAGWTAGTPAFSHDWKWPLDAAQSHDQLSTLASLWLPWGSGAPAIQALGNYPITLASWALGFVVPANVALLVVLAVIGACAAAGTAALARATGLPPAYQIVAAFCIAAMPAWFNRLHAGHLEWLLGYALFPGALALAIGRSDRRTLAGALGGLWGLAGGQAQFMFFFPLASLPFVIRARRMASAAAGFALMLGLQLTALVAMYEAQRVNALASQRANLAWQAAQSDPLKLALISAADPAHYFLHWQTGFTLALSFGIMVLAALGAVRTPVTRWLAAIWMISSLWSSGLDGPLAAPIAWLFTHVPNAVAFREFAHAQAVTAPVLLVLAAHGFARMTGRAQRRQIIGAAALFVVLLPLTAAALSGEIARAAVPIPASPDRDATVAQIRAMTGSGQILWWPGLDSVTLTALGTRGGVDSDAFVTGSHAPYLEYRPTAALAQVVSALHRGDRAACGLLGDLGIEAIVVRDGITASPGSAFAAIGTPPGPASLLRAGLRPLGIHGPYHVYGVPCYRGRFTMADAAQTQGDWSSIVSIARRAGATDEQTSPLSAPAGCSVKPFDPQNYRSTDPAHAWVPRSEADALFLAFDNAFSDVAITSDPGNTVAAVSLAAQRGGAYTWMTPREVNARLARHAIAIWEIARCNRVLRPTSQKLGAYPSQPFHSGTYLLASPRVIVAHYGPEAGWTLRAHGETAARPVAADGFATGWLLPAGRWVLALVQIGPPITVLWSVSVLAAAFCAFLMLDRRRRKA